MIQFAKIRNQKHIWHEKDGRGYGKYDQIIRHLNRYCLCVWVCLRFVKCLAFLVCIVGIYKESRLSEENEKEKYSVFVVA